MKKVILISGKAENGKSYAANQLKKLLESYDQKTVIMFFSKYIKMYLKDYFGWDGVTKDQWARDKFQELGTEKIRHKLGMPLFHVHRVTEDIKILSDYFDYFIVDDARFLNEIAYTEAQFPHKTVTIRVTRPNYKSSLTIEQQQHESETDLDDYKGFDYYIDNNESIENTLTKLINEIIPHDNLKVGDVVKIKRINNQVKAKHLKVYEGETGIILNWIRMDDESPKKYKVEFRNRETARFFGNELEFIHHKIPVSMGTLPILTKEQGKILLDDLEKATLKPGMFKGCGEELKRIIEEQGL
ncbi:hypothetical protein ACFHWD_03145 [Clostridium sp. MT-14]|uniref:hypothetical protein n=1 Tax=Clostridium sp. MT-14 TaxID=3348360 RepID=UPI0035F40EC6